MNYRRDHYSRCAVFTIIFTNIFLIWSVVIIPGQDLPQHLSYARIISDYDSLRFFEFYQISRFTSYSSIHRILAWLSKIVNLDFAIRLLLSTYILGMFLAFDFLVKAFQPDHKFFSYTSLLTTTLIFNPSFMMGFLPFYMTTPLILITIARFITWIESGKKIVFSSILLLLGILLLMHSFAFLCLLIFLFAWLCTNILSRRIWFLFFLVIALTLLQIISQNLLKQPWTLTILAESIRNTYGIEFLNNLFHFEWSHPLTLINYMAWTIFGSFPWDGLIINVVAWGGFLWLVWPDAKSWLAKQKYLKTIIVMLVITWLSPWAINLQNSLSFVNFRLFPVTFALLLALAGPLIINSTRGRLAIFLLAVIVTVQFTVRFVLFSNQASSSLKLLEKIPDSSILMPIDYHRTSNLFANQFQVTHFLPMYFTVIHYGISTQFWARYAKHLPVAYKKGKKPNSTPDWHPWEFNPNHLRETDYILVQKATDEDPKLMRSAYLNAIPLLDEYTEKEECIRLWCLYKVKNNWHLASPLK